MEFFHGTGSIQTASLSHSGGPRIINPTSYRKQRGEQHGPGGHVLGDLDQGVIVGCGGVQGGLGHGVKQFGDQNGANGQGQHGPLGPIQPHIEPQGHTATVTER